jgi:hypothetical protein
MTRRSKADTTRRPEAEKAYLAGLLELLTDDPPRCREVAQLVPAAALTVEEGGALLAAIISAAAIDAPKLADVARVIREQAIEPAADGQEPAFALMVDLAEQAERNRGGYSVGVERHAREIVKAAARRRTIVAADAAAAVAADPAAATEEIEAAAAAVAAASADLPSDRLEWQPCPVALLPDPMGTFVAEAAEAMGTDPAFVALPLLASVAAAIGNRRRIELWSGWQEPPVLWCGVVAESGSMKSPAAGKSLRFVRDRQRAAFAEHRAAMQEFEQLLREHDVARRKSKTADAADAPERPVAERLAIDDCTIEGLAPILEQNPRGVLLDRDELSGWFDFDRYSGGRGGAEVGRWLSIYDAGQLTVDRKHSGTIYVPSAAVSITGGIQPKTLARVVGSRHVDNGLLQRFILAAPPRRPKALPTADVGFATMAGMESMFDTLLAARPGDDGGPKVLDLEPDAADRFKAFYLEHGAEQFAASGPAASMLAKAEGWAARLALVCHMAAAAGSDPTRGDRVRLDSIEAGIGLARWAAREWQRVFHAMQHGAAVEDDHGLREWIAARGGIATPRDVARGLSKYRRPGAAEAALQRLARAGGAEWHPQPTGGRPADAVRLR